MSNFNFLARLDDLKYRAPIPQICTKTEKINTPGFEYMVGYEKSSDEFDIGHCRIKVKITAFSHLPQYELSSAISQLWNNFLSFPLAGYGRETLFSVTLTNGCKPHKKKSVVKFELLASGS